MYSDDSSDNEFQPAVLCRPTAANHVVHEHITVDTRDHEDHTFCGVMFDVEARDECPVAFLDISALWIRGKLGPITVWSLEGGLGNREASNSAGWQLIYENTHTASESELVPLALGDRRVRLEPKKKVGLYVHSKLPGDEAIVYDNQRGVYSHEDKYLRVHPGLAHLSNKPFGQRGMWWGPPWRTRREFVGRVEFGICYKLWNPEVHQSFHSNFRKVVKCLLLTAARPDSQLHCLSDAVIFYILNMCRYDWFDAEVTPDDLDDDVQGTSSRVRAGINDTAWDPGRHSRYHPRLGRGRGGITQFRPIHPPSSSLWQQRMTRGSRDMRSREPSESGSSALSAAEELLNSLANDESESESDSSSGPDTVSRPEPTQNQFQPVVVVAPSSRSSGGYGPAP